jgi:hypothetical protein
MEQLFINKIHMKAGSKRVGNLGLN